MLIAALIFAATYGIVAVGRLPFFRLDRAGAALLGAALMVASGTLSLDEASGRSISPPSHFCLA